MNRLKPVAIVIPDHAHGEEVTTIAQTVEYELPVGAELYILPDTHRVVSVELIERLIKVSAWNEHPTIKEARAIIDNKGATE